VNGLKEIAERIYKKLDELAVVDWSLKEDVKREMRRQIKRILRASGYSRDKIESTTLKIIDLAKARFVR